jgi:hypothetical protein
VLPAGPYADEGRTAMHVAVESPVQSAVRVEQVTAVAGFGSSHMGEGFPPVLIGDFNALAGLRRDPINGAPSDGPRRSRGCS